MEAGVLGRVMDASKAGMAAKKELKASEALLLVLYGKTKRAKTILRK